MGFFGFFNKEKKTALDVLANNLQKVRDYLQQFKVDQNKNVSVGISSGVRTQTIYVEGQRYVVFTSDYSSMFVIKK